MASTSSFVPLKREDHICYKDDFAELCKDAVRSFNGTPVCELSPLRLTCSGVYAIYCTAKKGLYERYGNKVNRMGYNVPIYVGKAVLKESCNGVLWCFEALSCQEQLAFWHSKIKKALGISTEDFCCRFFAMDGFEEKMINCVYSIMLEYYHPVWNRVFAECRSFDDVVLRWKQIHSVRFCSKAEKVAQDELKRFLEVA